MNEVSREKTEEVMKVLDESFCENGFGIYKEFWSSCC